VKTYCLLLLALKEMGNRRIFEKGRSFKTKSHETKHTFYIYEKKH
jgi:hypothetical protein